MKLIEKAGNGLWPEYYYKPETKQEVDVLFDWMQDTMLYGLYKRALLHFEDANENNRETEAGKWLFFIKKMSLYKALYLNFSMFTKEELLLDDTDVQELLTIGEQEFNTQINQMAACPEPEFRFAQDMIEVARWLQKTLGNQ